MYSVYYQLTKSGADEYGGGHISTILGVADVVSVAGRV